MVEDKETDKEGKMKKYTMVFMIIIIFMFATTLISYTEAGGNCGSNCSKQCEHLGSGPEWARCVENCVKECLKNDPPPVPPVPPPTPVKPSGSKSELKNFNSNSYANTEQDEVSATIVVASGLEDNDQPCYVGGKYVRDCSIKKRYLHVLSDECYATVEECKKQDGDLRNTPGFGGCVRCGHK
jgi:hypothetical protein